MPATLTVPHIESRKILVAGIAALIAGCGGGGGGDGNGPPGTPTVQLEADPTNVVVGGTSTLTWSSTNADTCQASGGWQGVRSPSGSESTEPISAATTFTLQCSGAGGSGTASVTVTIQAGNSSVAGNLLVPTTSRSDSDVNDPLAPFAPNDTMAQAQDMPNPVVVGGYVNVPGAGVDGRSFQSGDLDDFYRVDLLDGQVIELVIPSASALPGGDDADLFLVRPDGTVAAASQEVGQIERIAVGPPDVPAGTYFIDVFAFEGAPMYRLSVGQSTVSSSEATLRLNDEFVPGQLIVTLKDSTKGSAEAAETAAANATTLTTRFELSRKGGAPDRAMLLELPDDTTAIASMTPRSRAIAGTKRAATATGSPAVAPRPWRVADPAQQRKLDTILYAKMLRRDPSVRNADLNRIMRTSLTPNDASFPIQRWHYEQIQLPGAWDITTGSTAVRVAVVDTGIVTHPELSSKVIQGFDFVSSPSNQDGNGIDPIPADPGCVIGGGSVFHGTHVAGTIGARSNDPPTVPGVAGVSWGAQIMPIRVLDGCVGSGTSFDIIQGIRYAAGLSNDSGTVPPQRANIINMSFGSSGGCDPTAADLFAQVRAQGVAVVAAAGNDNSSGLQSPASCPNVISVAATGPLRTRAPYSNFGSTVDVAAPGGDTRLDIDGNGLPDGVYSTHANGGGANITPTLDFLQGTSMAAPHVAGVIALMLSVNPGLTPAQFDQLLAQGLLTDDIGPPGPDDLGQGLINARKAIGAADPSLPQPPPQISVTPSSLAFGDIGTTAQVVVSNAGGGTLTVTGVSPSAPWISVSATSVDANGLGLYTVTVDRTSLPIGSFSGFILFTSNGGTGRVDVLIEVAAASGEPNAGRQYILLLDPETNENLAQVDLLAQGSSVPYLLEGVASSQYILLSGTDLNNDGFICDPAEACGAFPVESAPVPITVDGAETGFDFVVSYRTGVPTSASSTGTKEVRKEIRPRRRIPK